MRRGQRVAWLAAAAAAGLIVGQLATHPFDFWRGLVVLGFVPGILQGVVLWRSEPVALLRWLAATQLGVICTYVFSVGAFVLVGSVAGLVARVVTGRDPSDLGAPPFLGWAIFYVSFFIGGAGLGGVQVTAFPRRQRRARWVIATMFGSVAVAPIALALVGLSFDAPLGLPTQVLGLLGGSLYGLVTAIALPPRPAT